MDYGLPDNTGVNHDLPLSKQRKISGRGRGFLHRRPMTGSGQFPPAQIDMETQIHQVEQEAYASVLRAFKAQSDAITWEKESLITELRKELRVSDEEHRELLSKVNAEELINEIREWRSASGLQPGVANISRPVQDREPHPTVSASRKKRKIPQAAMSLDVPPSMWSQPLQPASNKGQKITPPEDVKWNGQDQGIIHGTGHSGGSRSRKGGKSLKGDSRNHIPSSLNGPERDSSGVIEILHTNTLIKEVEQFLSANHLNPAELEKAKKVVKDHERALMDAIAKLDHASDGESGNN